MPLRQVCRKRSEQGNAAIEFGLSMIVLIPILFGTIAFGINLGNILQGTQIVRDVAHMYAEGIDFSQTSNQNIAVQLVQGLGGMTVNGGNGVLILSQIQEIYAADCTAGGYTSGQCTNLGDRVFINRVVIGNSSLRTSNYGTPNAAYISANDNIGSTDFLTMAGDQVSHFTDSVLPQAQGQVAYVVEGYFATPNLSFLGGFTSDTSGIYMVAIF
jgi:Flp pilus assembly protein TadG